MVTMTIPSISTGAATSSNKDSNNYRSGQHNNNHRLHVLSLVALALFSTTTTPTPAEAFVQQQQRVIPTTAGGRYEHHRRYYAPGTKGSSAPPADNAASSSSSSSSSQSPQQPSPLSEQPIINNLNDLNLDQQQRQQQQQQPELLNELVVSPVVMSTATTSTNDGILTTAKGGGETGDYYLDTKKILLESIESTDPQAVVFPPSAATTAASAAAAAAGLGVVGAVDNDVTSTPPPSTATELSVNEDVNAILSISEQAAAEIEATIPSEVLEQIETELASSSSPPPASTVDDVAASVTAAATSAATGTKQTTNVPEDILPASTIVVGEPKILRPKIDAPSVSKILKFAIPAIGVWLCGPLLSLIDTSAVGIFSGTVQQAALNPAVAVTDYAALLIAFLYTGTTNMVAAAQESDRGTTDKPRTAKTMIGAMQMSTYVGIGLGGILFAFARPLLKAIIGNDAISPTVFTAAMKYVKIRALGMPAAAIIGSTQAACLGMQDIRSPLYVLAAAAIVNFFGDILLVSSSHPWIGGAAGAAWATVISQYVAVAFFTQWLTRKSDDAPEPTPALNISSAILEITSKRSKKGKSRRQKVLNAIKGLGGDEKQTKEKTATDNFSVRGFLKNRFSSIDMLKLPSKEIQQAFTPYIAPVTTTQVGRVSGYVAMSHVIASSLGTVSMAAQQVIVSLFYCLCPIADSLSLTAQSLLPGIAEKEASPEKAAALRKSLLGFAKAGAVFGVGMMGAVSAIPLLSGFFTSDPAVTALVNSVVPLLLLFFGTHGIVCGAEGMLLGQKDLGFLGKMYAVFFAAVPFLMLRLKRAALTGSKAVNLASVWSIFVGYQVVRCGIWVARSLQLQKRTYRAGQESDYGLSP